MMTKECKDAWQQPQQKVVQLISCLYTNLVHFCTAPANKMYKEKYLLSCTTVFLACLRRPLFSDAPGYYDHFTKLERYQSPVDVLFINGIEDLQHYNSAHESIQVKYALLDWRLETSLIPPRWPWITIPHATSHGCASHICQPLLIPLRCMLW